MHFVCHMAQVQKSLLVNIFLKQSYIFAQVKETLDIICY